MEADRIDKMVWEYLNSYLCVKLLQKRINTKRSINFSFIAVDVYSYNVISSVRSEKGGKRRKKTES